MNESAQRRPRVSIRTALVVLVVGEIAIMVGLTSWLWYRNGRVAIRRVETELRTEVTARVKARIEDLLAQPVRINQINHDAFEMRLLDIEDAAKLEEYFWRQIQAFPDVAYTCVGTARGDFIGVERLADGTLNLELVTEATGRAMHTYVLGPARERLSRKERPNFVVQKRPWYAAAVKAGKPTWTGIYPYFSLPPRLGVSAVRPIRDDAGQIVGVLAADLVLENLSIFLRTVKVGRTGGVFIIERDGMLVASSSRESSPVTHVEGRFERIRALDFAQPLVRAAASYLLEELGDLASIRQDKQLRLRHEGEDILVQVAPVGTELGIDWLVVVVVPESDYLAEVEAGTRTTILLFVVLLVLAVITITVTARRITESILKVSTEMKQIADFRVGEYEPHPSVFKEITTMHSAMSSMDRALESFGRFVPVDVVRRLVRGGRRAELGLGPAEVTLFFMDITGFTSIAESIPADDLGNLMGEYMDEMTRIIESTNGTVDKYIGDEIMAFWNAPQAVPDHPTAAVRAAVQCQSRIEDLNESWAKRKLPRLRVRIGIHTGPVLVGTVGSQRRMNYTVLGDTVNVASRLEGLNKLYGTRTIVTEDTMASVSDEFLCRPLDTVTVKGKIKPTTIYEVVGRHDVSSAKRVRRLQRAFEAYRRRQFAEAKELYDAALTEHPDDRAAALLRDRCVEYLEHPPPQEWDGVYAVAKK